MQILVVDRAQGTVNYARWGGSSLVASGGLAPAVFVLLAAELETDFSGLRRACRQGGAKVILIAHSVSKAMTSEKIQIERASAPTTDQMTKALFMEHDWDVVKAKRLSRLAHGDWRKLHVLGHLLRSRRGRREFE